MGPVNDGIHRRYGRLFAALQFFQRAESRFFLLAGVNEVLEACGHSESADINMLHFLLYTYGNKNLSLEANELILNLTIKDISETERFG